MPENSIIKINVSHRVTNMWGVETQPAADICTTVDPTGTVPHASDHIYLEVFGSTPKRALLYGFKIEPSKLCYLEADKDIHPKTDGDNFFTFTTADLNQIHQITIYPEGHLVETYVIPDSGVAFHFYAGGWLRVDHSTLLGTRSNDIKFDDVREIRFSRLPFTSSIALQYSDSESHQMDTLILDLPRGGQELRMQLSNLEKKIQEYAPGKPVTKEYSAGALEGLAYVEGILGFALLAMAATFIYRYTRKTLGWKPGCIMVLLFIVFGFMFSAILAILAMNSSLIEFLG